jgi:hypothetical protein
MWHEQAQILAAARRKLLQNKIARDFRPGLITQVGRKSAEEVEAPDQFGRDHLD